MKEEQEREEKAAKAAQAKVEAQAKDGWQTVGKRR